MKPNCVAAIQMTSQCDVNGNLNLAERLVSQAVAVGAKLVILPEMFAVMGMDQSDKIKASESLGKGPIQDFLQELALKNKIWLVGGTIPIASESTDKVYATCLVYDDQGKKVAHYHKIHLFDVLISQTRESYHESKTIKPGNEIVVLQTPFGKLGLAICYDIRFPEMFRAMHDDQVELIAIPAAFTYTTGLAHWEILIRARAIENQVYIIAAAQTGTHENGRKTFGSSMIVDPWGKIQEKRLEGEGPVVGYIDMDYLNKIRSEFPVLSSELRIPFHRGIPHERSS